MAEYLRSVKVHVEMDTNKHTYVLDETFDNQSDAEDAVVEFLGREM